jgi:hypothetical protein
VIILSNGTKIEQVRQSSDCVKAIVLPDDREMTEAEYAEFVEVIRKDAAREVQHVKVASVSLFHHLLATAPFGMLHSAGHAHVRDCACQNCKRYRRVRP